MRGKDRISLCDYPARRIALIKPSSLGDIVQSLPVLTALRQRYPDAYIAWVVNRSFEPLLRGHPDLDSTIAFDREACRGDLLQTATVYRRFFRQLRRQRFDLAIDLQGLLRSGMMALACRAPRRVGFSSAREGARWFYTDVIDVGDLQTMHAVDRNWGVAEAFGVGAGPKSFHIPIPDTDRAWAAELLQHCPRPWLVLGVGARWVTKRWPVSHFGMLVQRAQKTFGGTVVFVGGADEAALARATAEYLWADVHDLSGKTNLSQLAAILALADVVVANDSGPLHLATALGRPVVAPYTCTKTRLNGPYGFDGGAVEAQVWCQGSYQKRCDRLECMAALTSNDLWPALSAILRAGKSGSPAVPSRPATLDAADLPL
jgi:heptosyltransferase-1